MERGVSCSKRDAQFLDAHDNTPEIVIGTPLFHQTSDFLSFPNHPSPG